MKPGILLGSILDRFLNISLFTTDFSLGVVGVRQSPGEDANGKPYINNLNPGKQNHKFVRWMMWFSTQCTRILLNFNTIRKKQEISWGRWFITNWFDLFQKFPQSFLRFQILRLNAIMRSISVYICMEMKRGIENAIIFYKKKSYFHRVFLKPIWLKHHL